MCEIGGRNHGSVEIHFGGRDGASLEICALGGFDRANLEAVIQRVCICTWWL